MIFVHYVNLFVPINLLYNSVLNRPCCTNRWSWIFKWPFCEKAPHF